MGERDRNEILDVPFPLSGLRQSVLRMPRHIEEQDYDDMRKFYAAYLEMCRDAIVLRPVAESGVGAGVTAATANCEPEPHPYAPRDCGGMCMACGFGKNTHWHASLRSVGSAGTGETPTPDERNR